LALRKASEDDVTPAERGFEGHDLAQSCINKVYIVHNRA
jgi:hypothetical protein